MTTILLVDDEPNIISSLRRLLRSETAQSYKVLGAGGGAEALELLASEPVDLIISDMRMPEMNGAQFLALALQRHPETTRLLLTGEADMQQTLAAINEGEIYRYITKPWNDAELLLTVRQALERRQLQQERQALLALTQQQNAELEQKVAERTAQLSSANEKLTRSYLASVKAFSSLIELRNAKMVGHARRVADIARRTAAQMKLHEDRQREIFVAGLLHDIGQIGLNDTVLAKPLTRLTPEELVAYRRHPTMGEQALLALDDMHAVSAIIRHHHERHDGQGYPDKLAGDSIPLGAAVLAVSDAYDDFQLGNLTGTALGKDDARKFIGQGRGTMYHPDVVDAFLELTASPPPPPPPPPVPRRSSELLPGMVLAKELVSRDGVVLLTIGHTLTADLIRRIIRHEAREAQGELVLMIKV